MTSLQMRGLPRMLALGILAIVFFTPKSSWAQAADGAAGPREQEAQAPAPQGQMIRAATKAPAAEKPEAARAPAGQTAPLVVNVRVDNTGVSSWRYRNPRNPPLVWDRTAPPPDRFRLQFINATSGATVKVTLPQVAVPFIAAGADGDPFNPPSLLGLDVATARREAHRLVNLSRELADKAQAYKFEESDRRIHCVAQFLYEEALENERALLSVVPPDAPQPEAPATAQGRKEAAQATASAGKTNVERIRGDGQAAAAAVPAPLPSEDCQIPDITAARVRLNTFRGDFRARADARPAAAVAAGLDALEQAIAAVVEYTTRVGQAVVAAAAPPPAAGPSAMTRAEQIFGVKLDPCETKNGQVTCVPTLTLAPNAEGWIEGRLLANYPAKGVIKFRVTFPFALETEQPADQFGYFSLDKELQESPTVVTWTAAGSLSVVREPYYGPDGTMVDAEHPYEGANTRQFRGTARTALSYALGNRATGTIEMQFKNSMLGRKDEDLAVKVNQYNFQVFGFTGSSLKFGKYLFAAPTDGLAINETGEGATVRFRWFGLSHILKREGVAGAADPNDDDHKVWLGDISNVAVPGWSSLRSLSFYALHGIDNTPDRERRYETFGGEALFGIPKVFVTGTAAYYYSRSRPHGGSPVRRADGSVWLGRASKSWFEGNKALRTLVVTVAEGSGDRPGTSDRYDGYLGENAAYSPDGSLFLSGVGPRVRLEPVPFVKVDRSGQPVLDKDGKTTPEFIDKGLSNRRFVGFAFSEQTFSPLEWAAIALQIPQRDVESRQSIFRLHYYSPTEQVLGTRDGSWEAQLEFLLESPKGVKYIVKYTRVLARGPLESLFPREPYSLIAQCNISLK